jgi:hypothetical protein
MDIVNKMIDTEETLVNQFDHDGKQDAGTSSTVGDPSSKFRKRPSEVLAADGRRPSTFNIEEFNAVFTFHEGDTHTVCECQQFKRAFCTPEDPKRPRSDGDRSSSRRYNNNCRDDRHGRQDNDRRDDQRRENHQPVDHREEHDLPSPRRQATPMARSNMQRGRSTLSLVIGTQHEQEEVLQGQPRGQAHPHQTIATSALVGAAHYLLQSRSLG